MFQQSEALDGNSAKLVHDGRCSSHIQRILATNFPRWNEVLLQIYKSRDASRYGERLNRLVRGSRTHLRKVISMLERHQLIEIIPSKKIKRILLTDKGNRVAALLLELRLALPER